MNPHQWFAYVPLDTVGEYLARGWEIVDDMADCHHGNYSNLMKAGPEAWLPVKGWEGLYEVSINGKVRSLDRMMVSEKAIRGYPRKMKGRILSPGRASLGGYLVVNLHRPDGDREPRYVAHLVADAWLGRKPDGFEVCHNDGDNHNNHANNLRYDTRLGNEADKATHGTRLVGEETAAARLTERDVRQIRRLAVDHDNGVLARRFGVSVASIANVLKRRTWVHLPVEEGEVGSEQADKARERNITAWRSHWATTKNVSDERIARRGEPK